MSKIAKCLARVPLINWPITKLYQSIWYVLAHTMNDVSYVKLRYRYYFHERCNLDNPTTFNEKLNWMKLYDRDPKYSMLADKYRVKEYVSNMIGKEYVVPNFGHWKSFDEIDFDSLPERFVLKATHDSSGATICKNKSTFDKAAAKKKFDKCIKTNYYYLTREWVYKDAQPQIIADELLDDHSGHELTDYKFWCFNGEPRVMYITNKGENIYENFYDMNYNVLDIDHGFPRRLPEYKKPEKFEEMKELASKLSKDIPFVRVDFFCVNNRVYFGEFTFYDWGGFQPFVKKEWDEKLGSWIKLPEKSFK